MAVNHNEIRWGLQVDDLHMYKLIPYYECKEHAPLAVSDNTEEVKDILQAMTQCRRTLETKLGRAETIVKQLNQEKQNFDKCISDFRVSAVENHEGTSTIAHPCVLEALKALSSTIVPNPTPTREEKSKRLILRRQARMDKFEDKEGNFFYMEKDNSDNPNNSKHPNNNKRHRDGVHPDVFTGSKDQYILKCEPHGCDAVAVRHLDLYETWCAFCQQKVGPMSIFDDDEHKCDHFTQLDVAHPLLRNHGGKHRNVPSNYAAYGYCKQRWQ